MAIHPIEIEDHPAAEDVQFLEDQINAFNCEITGYFDFHPLAIFVRGEQGRIVAGLTGGMWGGCCEIKFLWVRENLRRQGYGTRLMRAAEQEALAHGYSVIVLSSHSFQAPGFYQKLGYEVVGETEGYPRAHSVIHLRKELA
jgi:ribosomal protein S18 acetylase RimI-like enzyme